MTHSTASPSRPSRGGRACPHREALQSVRLHRDGRAWTRGRMASSCTPLDPLLPRLFLSPSHMSCRTRTGARTGARSSLTDGRTLGRATPTHTTRMKQLRDPTHPTCSAHRLSAAMTPTRQDNLTAVGCLTTPLRPLRHSTISPLPSRARITSTIFLEKRTPHLDPSTTPSTSTETCRPCPGTPRTSSSKSTVGGDPPWRRPALGRASRVSWAGLLWMRLAGMLTRDDQAMAGAWIGR